MEILPRSFYEADTLDVARELLGMVVMRRVDDQVMTGRIVETEAYKQHDAACHAYRGKTDRNWVMFGPAGFTYIYFSYGMHYMLNVVTAAVGCGEAVLIRALEPIDGVEYMRKHAGVFDDYAAIKLLSGPGKLAKSLAINRETCNELDVTDAACAISIWSTGDILPADQIETSTRIGISQAVEHPWRFFVRGSAAVSRR